LLQAYGGINVKTIGVLGGFGPQATMDFEARVHRVAQRLIPQKFNRGYPPIIVWYCRHPSGLADDNGQLRSQRRPDERLLEAAKRLGAVADFLVIPSNGVHLFHTEIEQASGRRLLSMIEATLSEVRRRGWTRVGVLGLGEPIVYTRPLQKLGIACEILDPSARGSLDCAIFRTMEGRGDEEQFTATARVSVAMLRGKNVDGIILGCTELPVLLGHAADNEDDFINPAQMLAERAVRAALSD
jgi:aspartate racemase